VKRAWLIGSVLLTAIVLSFSLQSGEASGELSGSLSASIHALITRWIPALALEQETLHWLIRKAAHLGSYAVLGLAWGQTFFLYGKKLPSCLLFGGGLAILGEILQLLAQDRGPSLVDALMFNALGYAIGSILHGLIQKKRMSTKQNVS
jgi:VanZ family protein